MVSVQIQAKGTISFAVRRLPNGWFIGDCEPLGLCLDAPTLDELDATLREGLQELFRSLFQHGDLPKFLNARGWHMEPLPHGISPNELFFEAPVKLEREYHAGW